MDVNLGQYALSPLIGVFLTIIYKMVPIIPDKWKALISIGIGLGLGMTAIGYQGLSWTFVNIVDFALYGLMSGAAAVGLYEGVRTKTNPRA